ncbi:MAG: hypothetical protein JSW08_02855 [archaeon]|nr:MAG: hypothetical protein JSW08_02855 [archaeon]
MRIRELMFLFGLAFLVVSGIALIKSAGYFSIFGMAISDKLSGLPASPLIYTVIIFVLAIICILVALTERKIIY